MLLAVTFAKSRGAVRTQISSGQLNFAVEFQNLVVAVNYRIS